MWRIPGRPLWTLLNDVDVKAMRRQLGPGQVWMRVDELDNVRAQWPLVDSAARLQRELLAAPFGQSGRPRGPTPLSDREQAFVASGQFDASLPLTELYRRGLAAGVWEDDGRRPYARRNLDRARRLRERIHRVRPETADGNR